MEAQDRPKKLVHQYGQFGLANNGKMDKTRVILFPH